MALNCEKCLTKNEVYSNFYTPKLIGKDIFLCRSCLDDLIKALRVTAKGFVEESLINPSITVVSPQ